MRRYWPPRIAVGYASLAVALNSAAIGNFSAATANDTLALGVRSKAGAANAWAVGNLSQALGDNSNAIGSQALAATDNTLAYGILSKGDAHQRDRDRPQLRSFRPAERHRAVGRDADQR